MLAMGTFSAGVTHRERKEMLPFLRLEFHETLTNDIDDGKEGGESYYCTPCSEQLRVSVRPTDKKEECQCETCKSMRFDLSVHIDALAHLWAEGVGSNHLSQVKHHEERVSLLQRLLSD